jgi:hypothetical protein
LANGHTGSSLWPITLDEYLAAALKRELLMYGGCLIMFWAIGAASFYGLVITALFALVAIGHVMKRAANVAVASMPKRSALRHYVTGLASLCLFCLVIARACYIATVLIDTKLDRRLHRCWPLQQARYDSCNLPHQHSLRLRTFPGISKNTATFQSSTSASSKPCRSTTFSLEP